VRNEEVLKIVKEERNILHTIKRRKENWIGLIWRWKRLLKHVTEGKTERKGVQGRRRKQLPDGLNPLNAELNPICQLLALLGAHPILHVNRIRVKEKSGYCELKEEALDRTVWGTGFGRVYGSVVRQATK
jgi:hypothetical protein